MFEAKREKGGVIKSFPTDDLLLAFDLNLGKIRLFIVADPDGHFFVFVHENVFSFLDVTFPVVFN